MKHKESLKNPEKPFKRSNSADSFFVLQKTIREVVVEKTKAIFSQSDSNEAQAQKLFQVFLGFIQTKKWVYNGDCFDQKTDQILNARQNIPQTCNCYDMANAFLSLCNTLGIEDTGLIVVRNKPIVFCKPFSPDSPVAIPFDNMLSDYTDNEALFDKHAFARVGNQYFDITFSTYFFDINAPFDSSIFGQAVEAINNRNEQSALDLVHQLPKSDLSKTFDGWNLLHHSANFGLENLVSYLLSRGLKADALTSHTFPLTALELVPIPKATDYNNMIIDIFADHLQPVLLHQSLFSLANRVIIQEDDHEGITVLLAKGLPIDFQNETGSTLLHLACIYGRGKTLSVLIDFGANIDIQDENGFCLRDLYPRYP